jgi:DNA-directed RNA polymerase subunit RPC12/RpoP
MPKSPIAAIRPPRCPKCRERMLLIRLEPGGGAVQVQTYECPKCGKSKIIERADPMNEARGWLAGRDLQKPE